MHKKLIIAETAGIFLRSFIDFGENHIVNDRDGE